MTLTRTIRIPLRSYDEGSYGWHLKIAPGGGMRCAGRIFGQGRSEILISLDELEEAADRIEEATGDTAADGWTPITDHERAEVARILRAAMTPPPSPPPDWDPVAEIPF